MAVAFGEEVILYGDFLCALQRLQATPSPDEECCGDPGQASLTERKWFRICARQLVTRWIPVLPEDEWIPRALFSEICSDMDIGTEEFYAALHETIQEREKRSRGPLGGPVAKRAGLPTP